ncbi:hypothetical protein M407DRAFT_7249 [Tulasnella calospora MUT 4182]|uniref:Uncharacterized protein n=1 Tax=Tulasnella calospora MUT 4182 TaxID=1051891 RepID=A0A0C3QLF8_9AGAM|nr:hypothetical protein M407DRAFT_7249 [Tulasnella calospora MUT 4182]
MSKQSKPCWDECRFQLGIPDWCHVASPQAMVFIYENACQGVGCDEPIRLKLLDLEDVRREWPDLPQDLVTRLPWTSKRPVVFAKDVRNGRFYLKDDVLKLLRHFRRLEYQPSWALTSFRAELIARQRERQAIAVEMLIWFDRTAKRQQRRFNERWDTISAVMSSRWRWNPVPYAELPGRLKQIVDYLISLPDLTDDTWGRVRGDLTRAIREKPEAARDDRQRPFSLKGTASSSKSGSSFTE